jgi:hypothetical protein
LITDSLESLLCLRGKRTLPAASASFMFEVMAATMTV